MSHCDRRWEVAAYREGRLGTKDAESFERHLRACAECKLHKDRDERLRALGRSIGQPGPDDMTLRRLRMRVLRDAATGAAPRGRLPRTHLALAAGLVIAVTAGGAWLARGRPAAAPVATITTAASAAPAEAFAGSVTAVGDAHWSRSRQDGVERVTLSDGEIEVHVRTQRVDERFLIELPNGELEVRGTTFDVSVARGATSRVHVDEGHVELRLHGQPAVLLGGGDVWTPPAAPAVVAQKTPLRLAPSGAPAASVTGTAPDEGAAIYAQAVDLLRAGRGDDAAAAFHAFLLAHPAAPQAEDASFLEAVALARAGRGDAAALAAEHHLASFPGSFHRKEAAILVARGASQRGDCTRARAVLAPWLDSSDARTALGTCQVP